MNQRCEAPAAESRPVLGGLGVSVDPVDELGAGLKGRLEVEPQGVGGVAVPLSPAATRGRRLDEVRQRDPHPDLGGAQSLEHLDRPGQLVQPELAHPKVVALEGDELVLDYQGDGRLAEVSSASSSGTPQP